MPSSNVRWPTPLTRQNPWYPGQTGVPGTDTETGLRSNTLGTIFYVDPNYPGASDARDGTNPTDPLLTVQTAIDRCGRWSGDVVAVMANGDWQYSGHVGRQATIQEEVTVSTDGIRIVGIAPSTGLGVYWQPAQNDGVCITINALDVLVEGFCFWNEDYTGGTGVLSQWTGNAAPLLQGENTVIRNCHFDADLDYGIALDYVWYAHVLDNYFANIGIAAIHNLATTGDPDFSVFARNYFFDCALAISVPGVDGCLICDNWINGDPAVANSYINTNGGGNNLVTSNSLTSSLAQYTGPGNCNSAATDGWVNNFCIDGPTVAIPG